MTEELKNDVALALTDTLSKLIDEEVKKQVANQNKVLILHIKSLMQNVSYYCEKAQDNRESAYDKCDDITNDYVYNIESNIDDVKDSIDGLEYSLDDLEETIDEALDYIDDFVNRIEEETEETE